jgi:hypothetical protein
VCIEPGHAYVCDVLAFNSVIASGNMRKRLSFSRCRSVHDFTTKPLDRPIGPFYEQGCFLAMPVRLSLRSLHHDTMLQILIRCSDCMGRTTGIGNGDFLPTIISGRVIFHFWTGLCAKVSSSLPVKTHYRSIHTQE